MKIVIYDYGLNTEIGISLVRAGHKVLYYSPWNEAFPRNAKASVGVDLDGMKRTDDFWESARSADAIICPDTFSRDIVNECRANGWPTFGAADGEILELNRDFCKRLMKKVGLPCNNYRVIKGVEALSEYLKKNTDKWIKIDKFRGDIETFHHEKWDSSQSQFLGHILLDFGANAHDLEFIVEDPIDDAVEIGYDGFVVNGEHMLPALMGYEDKDNGYIGKFCNAKQIPACQKLVCDKLAPTLKTLKTTSLVSYELRVTPDGKGYLIDPCVRAPHPPLAAELVAYTNFANLIINAAHGKLDTPTAREPYVAVAEIKSDWVENHWTELEIDPAVRDRIKLQQACFKNGKYYALPGSFIVGNAVGIGASPEAALRDAERVLAKFKCRGIHHDIDGIRKMLKKDIEEGKKRGLDF